MSHKKVIISLILVIVFTCHQDIFAFSNLLRPRAVEERYILKAEVQELSIGAKLRLEIERYRANRLLRRIFDAKCPDYKKRDAARMLAAIGAPAIEPMVLAFGRRPIGGYQKRLEALRYVCDALLKVKNPAVVDTLYHYMLMGNREQAIGLFSETVTSLKMRAMCAVTLFNMKDVMRTDELLSSPERQAMIKVYANFAPAEFTENLPPLAELGEAACEPLLIILADESVCREALAKAEPALAAIGQPAVTHITELLTPTIIPQVRAAGCRILGKIGRPLTGEAIEQLHNALEDSNFEVSDEAAIALGATGYLTALPHLGNMLCASKVDYSPGGRKGRAINVLAGFGGAAIEPLMKYAEYDPKDRRRVIEALAASGDKVVKDLVQLAANNDAKVYYRYIAVIALQNMRDRKGMRPLREALGTEFGSTFYALHHLFGRSPYQVSLPYIDELGRQYLELRMALHKNRISYCPNSAICAAVEAAKTAEDRQRVLQIGILIAERKQNPWMAFAAMPLINEAAGLQAMGSIRTFAAAQPRVRAIINAALTETHRSIREEDMSRLSMSALVTKAYDLDRAARGLSLVEAVLACPQAEPVPAGNTEATAMAFSGI